jgi:hypothetical protein
MMFSHATVPYPRQDEIDANEDGVGFALRMATLNGLTFSDLARVLASPGHLYLPAQASNAVAFMFGCTPARLELAFVRRYFGAQTSGAFFLGHDFLRTYHLRQVRPQLCPMCLRQVQKALAAWSISLITCCPVHGIQLLDRCVCGRAISWRRPSIDFCECGQRLTAPYQPCEPADPRELAVASQITYLLGSAHFRLQATGGLPTAFDDLSVDTFLRLLWAFGVIEENQAADHPRSANRIFSTKEASALVCRAYDRLRSIVSPRVPMPVRLRITASALEAIYSDCATPADAQLINAIILRLHRSGERRLARRASDIRMQLTLFGDACD